MTQPADGHDVDVAENPEHHVDTETDVLLGGQGWDDLVSGQEGVVNPDTVLAGAGIDAITYAGPQAPGGQLDGGIGAGDRLVLALPPGATSIDPAVGHATMTGGTVSWARIEWFTLATSDDAEREVSYRGTDADDEVQVEGTVTLVADLAGGDDILTALRAPAAGSAIDAGPGRDVVMLLERTGRLDLDMRAGVLEVAAGSSTHALPAAGFEVAFIAAPSVRVAGTARRNYLVVEACRAEISGRGGADSVRSYGSSGLEMSGPTCRDRARIDGGAGADEISSGGNVRDTISGGPGRDQLWGARGPDRLTGGSGHDSVDGGPGPRPDTCRAEEETRCER